MGIRDREGEIDGKEVIVEGSPPLRSLQQEMLMFEEDHSEDNPQRKGIDLWMEKLATAWTGPATL